MKIKYLALVIALIAIVASVTGCATSTQNTNRQTYYPDGRMASSDTSSSTTRESLLKGLINVVNNTLITPAQPYQQVYTTGPAYQVCQPYIQYLPRVQRYTPACNAYCPSQCSSQYYRPCASVGSCNPCFQARCPNRPCRR